MILLRIDKIQAQHIIFKMSDFLWSCKYMIISQQITEIHDFFFCWLDKFKIILPDNSKTRNQLLKYKLFSWLIFYKCAILFCTNKLLFSWKLVRFMTNCRIVNFSCDSSFLSVGFFFLKINCFIKNRQIVKIWTFLKDDIF